MFQLGFYQVKAFMYGFSVIFTQFLMTVALADIASDFSFQRCVAKEIRMKKHTGVSGLSFIVFGRYSECLTRYYKPEPLVIA